MRKALFVVLALLVVVSSSWARSWVSLGGDPGQDISVQVLMSDEIRTVLEFQLAGYWMDDVSLDGEHYAVLSIPGATPLMNKGLPDLPKVMRSIIIPDMSKDTTVNSHVARFCATG